MKAGYKKYRKIMPSNLVIAFFLIPILGIIIFFTIKKTVINSEKNSLNGADNFKSVVLEQSQQKDTDNDGLYDWQETMYGTDKNNADSDGDGALDGLEVKLGTSPTDPKNKKASDRKKIKELTAADDDKENVGMDTNRTGIIAKEFLLKVADLKGSNLINNASTQSFVVDELLKENNFSFKNKYKLEDLNIAKISKDDFKKNFGKVILDKKSTKDSFQLMAMYLESKNLKYLEELKQNTIIAKKYEQELLKLKVSKNESAIFLVYLNVISEHALTLEMMSEIENDTVTALYGFSNYKNITNKIEKINKEIILYFK